MNEFKKKVELNNWNKIGMIKRIELMTKRVDLITGNDVAGSPGLFEIAAETLDRFAVREAEARIARGDALEPAAAIARQTVDGSVGRRFQLPVDALSRLHGHLKSSNNCFGIGIIALFFIVSVHSAFIVHLFTLNRFEISRNSIANRLSFILIHFF